MINTTYPLTYAEQIALNTYLGKYPVDLNFESIISLLKKDDQDINVNYPFLNINSREIANFIYTLHFEISFALNNGNYEKTIIDINNQKKSIFKE